MRSAWRLAAFALLCAVVVASTQTDGDESELELDLSMEDGVDMALPKFPLPPKHDLELLHMDKQIDADVDMRFRQQFEDEESEADETESESESDDENADEEETDESDEAEADADADEEDVAEAPSQQFVQLSQSQRQMAGSQYDTYGMLPRGRIPWHLARPETAPAAYARAAVNPSSIPDAVFQPIHRMQKQFGRAGMPVPSLAAGGNNYAWSTARVVPKYVYGNMNLPVPVNAQFYPPPFRALPRSIQPPPQPPASPPASPLFSPSVSFAELGAGAVNFRAGGYAPYAPALPSASTVARNPTADLMASNYQSYSSAQWPSSIAPPASYYLPPDVVV